MENSVENVDTCGDKPSGGAVFIVESCFSPGFRFPPKAGFSPNQDFLRKENVLCSFSPLSIENVRDQFREDMEMIAR